MGTVLDNITVQELKLIDKLNNKISLSFGDIDITDGYSYGRIKFLLDDVRFTIDTSRDEFNIIAKRLLLDGKKVWSELCQGPNSGMNADLLDGKHSSEFKDIYGTTFFKHMFKPNLEKMFIRVATFTTKRVGTPNDFNENGTSPYTGYYDINAKIANDENKKNFLQETTSDLKSSSFHSVGLTTPGMFNASLRATVSLLKGTKSTTFDLHLGIFEDPKNSNKDAWISSDRFFFVSNHNNDLPFIDEVNDSYLSKEVLKALEVAKTKVKILKGDKKVSKKIKDAEKVNDRAAVTPVENYHVHDRPPMDTNSYIAAPDPTKDYVKPSPFPSESDEGKSYGKYLDIARLYYNGEHTDLIDGVEVVTQVWDLYIAADNKTEIHFMPIQSSGCSFTNFEKPISPSSLVNEKYIRPKSIYDDRYSHRNHRHYDYEQKIWHIIEEVDNLWDAFDNYVPSNQGTGNANKILMTDSNGNIFANVDNLERHQDTRRRGDRVLVTAADKCLVESSVTASELSQLKNIKSNIQQQIDEIIELIRDINSNINNILNKIEEIKGEITNLKSSVSNLTNAFNEYKVQAEDKFVNCSGDSMTGDLYMKPSPTSDLGVIFQSSNGRHNCKIYGGNENSTTTVGMWDSKNSRYVWKYCCDEGDYVHLASRSLKIGGKKMTISNTAPGSPSTGDVWIKSW